MNNDEPTYGEGLTELNRVQNGKAPAQRLSDPNKARQLGWRMVYGQRARSERNARIQGQIDGNPPFNSATLRNMGQAWRANFNSGEAEGQKEAAVTPYYDLFSGAENFMGVKTKFGENSDERNRYNEVISQIANDMLHEWEDFDFEMQCMIEDLVTPGKGFLVWFDPIDWKYEWIDQARVYTTERSKATTAKVPFIMIRGSYEVWELWEHCENEHAKDIGWNVSTLKTAIERAYPRNMEREPHLHYEEIQRWIKDNQLWEGVTAETVNVFHFFIREYSGKVSHLIVEEREEIGDTNQGTGEESVQWLFQAKNKFDSMEECISAFFLKSRKNGWNGVTGLGRQMYSIFEVKNRLLCQSVDTGFRASALTIQAKTSEALTKLNTIQFGAVNVIPPDFEVQSGQMMADAKTPMVVNDMLDMIVTRNTGIYRPRMERPEGNPRTAREVDLEFSAGATLNNSAVARFYLSLDAHWSVMYGRMKNDSDFKKRLKEAGVPQEAADKVYCVYAVRSVGNGSPYMRKQALAEMTPLVALMPEEGRRNWLEDRVSSITGPFFKDRYVPKVDAAMKTDDAAWAVMEHTTIQAGQQPIVSGTQNHIIHAQIHLKAGADALASAQQMPPDGLIKVSNFIEGLGQHIAVHLAQIAGDKIRQADYHALEEQLIKMGNVAEQLRRVIEQIAKKHAQAAGQQQQQNGQPDPDTMAKMEKTRAEIAMKEAKNRQLMQHKEMKFRQSSQETALKTQQEMAIADAQAAGSMAREHAEAMNKPEPVGK